MYYCNLNNNGNKSKCQGGKAQRIRQESLDITITPFVGISTAAELDKVHHSEVMKHVSQENATTKKIHHNSEHKYQMTPIALVRLFPIRPVQPRQ